MRSSTKQASVTQLFHSVQKLLPRYLDKCILGPPGTQMPSFNVSSGSWNFYGLCARHDESEKEKQAIYIWVRNLLSTNLVIPLEKELAVLWCRRLKRLRHYMLYHTTLLIFWIDQLQYLFEKPALSRRLARWHLLLVEFDIAYAIQKSKGQRIAKIQKSKCKNPTLLLADHLAKNPINDISPWRLYFRMNPF